MTLQFATVLYSFILGLVFGIGGCLTILVLLYLKITIPKSKVQTEGFVWTSECQNCAEPIAQRGQESEVPVKADLTKEVHKFPHTYSKRGFYEGLIYTIPASRWSRDEISLVWPPPSPNFDIWWASLDQGTLVLKPVCRISSHADLSVRKNKKRDQSSPVKDDCNQNESNRDQTKESKNERHNIHRQPLGIPLEGCTIELVHDGLKGRSDMNRRAPLLLSHSTWPLIENESSFYIFANDPASKQQWLHALNYWCDSRNSERLALADNMYMLFCKLARQSSLLPYPCINHDASLGQENFESQYEDKLSRFRKNSESLQRSSGRRGWKKSSRSEKEGRRQMETTGGNGQPLVDFREKKGMPSLCNLEHGQSNSKPNSGQRDNIGFVCNSSDPQRLDCFIEDLWMGPSRRKRKNEGSSVHSISAPSSPSPSLPRDTHHSSRGSLKDTLDKNASGYELKTGTIAQTNEAMPIDKMSLQHASTSSTSSKELTFADATTKEVKVDYESPLKPTEKSRLHHEIAGVTSIQEKIPNSAEYFVNSLLTRLCFDSFRNPIFTEYIRSRVQGQLARMPMPMWVTSLEVLAIEPGASPPSIANIRYVPCLEDVLAPQVLFDFKYEGNFSVILGRFLIQMLAELQRNFACSQKPIISDLLSINIAAFKIVAECIVDIRDAPAWEHLDNAIARIGGKASMQRNGSGISSMDSLDSDTMGDSASNVHKSESRYSLDQVWEEEKLDAQGMLNEKEGKGIELQSPSPRETDSPGQRGKQLRQHIFGSIRSRTAKTLRNFAEQTASHIKQTPLRISLSFEKLEGTMCAWIPPPPGNRIFWSFLQPPILIMKAKPEIGGRLLKYAVHASRVSSWLQKRMQISFKKNMVYPSGADIPLFLLLALENPCSGCSLPNIHKKFQENSQSKKDKHDHSIKKGKTFANESEEEIIILAENLKETNDPSNDNRRGEVNINKVRPRNPNNLSGSKTTSPDQPLDFPKNDKSFVSIRLHNKTKQ